MNPALNTRWNCFGCKRGGNAIDFLSEYENISRQEASTKLKQIYAAGFVAPRFGSIAREFEARYKASKERHVPKTVKVLDWSIADQFAVDWAHYNENYRNEPDVAYMLDRGFTPDVLEEWGIGYDYDSSRITIPVCDPHGNLVGFKGRAWKKNARPKYLVMGNKGQRQRYDFDTYDKTLVVFGLDKWGEQEYYVLVEGELDVISLWMMGIPAICCGGSTMSTEQAKLIRQYCDEVVLFFDMDGAGRNGVYGYTRKNGEHRPGILELLEPHMRVRVVGKHRYDANDYLRRGEQDRAHALISSAKSSILL
jgi:DNA primase